MSKEPTSFLRTTFPALFEKGIALLEARAAQGDATAATLLANVKGVDGAAVIELTGAGTTYIAAQGGKLTASDAPIAGVKVKVVARVPAEAVEIVLGEAIKEGALDNDRVAIAATQVASKELEDMLAGREMTCLLTIADTPDLDDVTVALGFNVEAVPATPKFTVTLKYDDYEAVRAKKLNVQQLFMGGKLRMTGDYSVALQIAMQLAAKAQERAKKI